MNNRSVPTDTILPHVIYRNLPEAIAWLTSVFGFVEHYRYGDPNSPSGAQMRAGRAWIMVRDTRGSEQTPAELGYGTQSLTILIDDVEKHYAHTQTEGAKIVEELRITEYGEFQYAVLDLDGHHWVFSRHARDADPASWGAQVTNLF
ncbi:VOC family protein [Terracidiphilus gabretensis]|jgi:uncharacterized glyoxalase superfamily protein PhnB|uniref:VOC family protein n=1 Tax=Terracidiphilus gabretensis TaxID=1577687 RepID=UPI0018D1FE0A|nr:VOC family protein [Terracidiphilus gabretensis]